MAVVHKSASGPGVTTVGGIVFGEHKLAHGIESCRLPRGHKAVHTVPAVEAHHQCVFFKDAVHLQRGRLQPFVRHIPGNLSALTVLKTDEVRRIGHNKVHGTVGESAHHINTVPENESGHGSTPVVRGGRRHHRDTVPCRTLPVHRVRSRVRPTVEYRSRPSFGRQGYAAKAA
ncbi:Uncharacterised protein [Klebsiella pneumoniae]|nr:Uncharacterised protein [Klebsiella pneumoniae]